MEKSSTIHGYILLHISINAYLKRGTFSTHKLILNERGYYKVLFRELVVYRMVSRKRVVGKVWEGVGDEYTVTN